MIKEQQIKAREKALENINLLTEIEQIICDIIDSKSDTHADKVSESEQRDVQLIKNYFYHLKYSGEAHTPIDSNIFNVASIIAKKLTGKLGLQQNKINALKNNGQFLKEYIFSWFNAYGQEMCDDGKAYYELEQANRKKIADLIPLSILTEFNSFKRNNQGDKEFLVNLGKILYKAIKTTDLGSVASYFGIDYTFLNDICQNYLKPEFDRKP